MRPLLLLVVSFLFGCAAQGPIYQKPSEPPNNYANVVIYRLPTMQGSAWATDFEVDGKEVASLRIRGYTRILVKSGTHTVSMGTLRLSLNAQAGQTYFVRYGTEVSSVLMVGPTPIVEGKGLFSEVSMESAMRELPNYRYTEPSVPVVD